MFAVFSNIFQVSEYNYGGKLLTGTAYIIELSENSFMLWKYDLIGAMPPGVHNVGMDPLALTNAAVFFFTVLLLLLHWFGEEIVPEKHWALFVPAVEISHWVSDRLRPPVSRANRSTISHHSSATGPKSSALMYCTLLLESMPNTLLLESMPNILC